MFDFKAAGQSSIRRNPNTLYRVRLLALKILHLGHTQIQFHLHSIWDRHKFLGKAKRGISSGTGHFFYFLLGGHFLLGHTQILGKAKRKKEPLDGRAVYLACMG